MIIISSTNQAIVSSVLVHPDFQHPCKVTYSVSLRRAFRLLDSTFEKMEAEPTMNTGYLVKQQISLVQSRGGKNPTCCLCRFVTIAG